MIAIEVKMTQNPALLSKRALREAMKRSFAAAGEYWMEHYRPKHFSSQQTRYRYKPRKQRYLDRKQRDAKRPGTKIEDGGTRLLVYSGLTRRSMLTYHPVRAYPTRLSIRMPGPRYVGMRPYKSGRPNLGEEITQVTPDEKRQLMAVFERALQKEIDAYKERTSGA